MASEMEGAETFFTIPERRNVLMRWVVGSKTVQFLHRKTDKQIDVLQFMERPRSFGEVYSAARTRLLKLDVEALTEEVSEDDETVGDSDE